MKLALLLVIAMGLNAQTAQLDLFQRVNAVS